MKTLWSAFSFLAVIHLLALLLFLGWLWQSGRLNGDRISRMRAMLSETIQEEIAKEEAAALLAAEESERLRAEGERTNPPVPSAEQARLLSMIQEQESMAMRRLADERDMLLAQLHAADREVRQREETLQGERIAWEQASAAERNRMTDEQFRQTVKQYESVPPKQAKQMIEELIRSGGEAGEMQAVAYVDAMNPRSASKILREFKTPQEIALATKLLEKLRTYGAAAVRPEIQPSNAPERPAEPS